MFGEDLSESPRMPSPWRVALSEDMPKSPSPLNLDTPSSTPGTPTDVKHSCPISIRRQSSSHDLFSGGIEDDFDGLLLGEDGNRMKGNIQTPRLLKLGLSPEVDKKGHIEYKLKLLSPSPLRLAKLQTQLKWRLVEGGGMALYELGVLDNGSLVGLNRKEMNESLETLGRMLAGLGGGYIRIARVVRLETSRRGSAGTSDAETQSDGGDSDNNPSSSSSQSLSYSSVFKSFSVEPDSLPLSSSAEDNESDLATGSDEAALTFQHSHLAAKNGWQQKYHPLHEPTSIRQEPDHSHTPEERQERRRKRKELRDNRRAQIVSMASNGTFSISTVLPASSVSAATTTLPPPILATSITACTNHGLSPPPPPSGPSTVPDLEFDIYRLSKKALAKLSKSAPTSSPIAHYKPGMPSNGEERFVVEAVVQKGHQTRNQKDDKERRRAASDEPIQKDEDEEEEGEGGESQGEGWRYLDFDFMADNDGGGRRRTSGENNSPDICVNLSK